MILPWLKGFLGYSKAPLMWLLVLLNFLVFAMTNDREQASPVSSLANATSLELTGRLYYQYQNPHEKKLPLKGANQWMILGGQGLRDPQFVTTADAASFFGDEIAITQWKKDLKLYQNQMSKRSSSIFGLNTEKWNWTSWVTYQFMHAGFIHLISNMMLLLIFGAAVEVSVGGFSLILIYLLSGLGGGIGYFYLGGHTLIPMIGASGSLSGVMAFYAAYEVKKRVSFFYFISPLKGFFGWIYLPTWLIFPLCFLPDIVGYISTPAEVGAGVAYTAHIGGAIAGVTLGLLCRLFRAELKGFFQATKPSSL